MKRIQADKDILLVLSRDEQYGNIVYRGYMGILFPYSLPRISKTFQG